MNGFVLSFINDIAKTFTCSSEYVRVFELTHDSSVVKWGFTTLDHEYTLLQLNPNDFERKNGRDYRVWYCHGLRILGKHDNDIRWLGMTNSSL